MADERLQPISFKIGARTHQDERGNYERNSALIYVNSADIYRPDYKRSFFFTASPIRQARTPGQPS